MQNLVYNLPILYLAYRVFGRLYAVDTIFGTVALSVILDATHFLVDWSICADPMLNSIFGGVLAGVGFGIGGVAGHLHKYYPASSDGYMGRLNYVQDVYADTAACLLIRKEIYDEVGGLDESYAVAFNDVDFCVRVRQAGYTNVFTPFAQLYHYESKSRGGDEKDPVKARRFAAEQQRLYAVHGKANILHDPYYNPNLTMDREDFSESNDLRGLKEGRITVQWRG